ncbi:hypothetical protein B566_EDAN013437 [Ephemera danica]|nr:hypothetical protein B566_EDAN013437 [Ephemera danica]
MIENYLYLLIFGRCYTDLLDLTSIFQHTWTIVALIMIQICLGVSELLNYEQIHDGVLMATFHTGYEDHKRPWDELMKNFNCCGVYGSDRWDRFEFPCLEPGILKVGCPDLLVSHITHITQFIAISLLLISAYQLYHVMAIKKIQRKKTEIAERRILIYL